MLRIYTPAAARTFVRCPLPSVGMRLDGDSVTRVQFAGRYLRIPCLPLCLLNLYGVTACVARSWMDRTHTAFYRLLDMVRVRSIQVHGHARYDRLRYWLHTRTTRARAAFWIPHGYHRDTSYSSLDPF